MKRQRNTLAVLIGEMVLPRGLVPFTGLVQVALSCRVLSRVNKRVPRSASIRSYYEYGHRYDTEPAGKEPRGESILHRERGSFLLPGSV